MRVRERENLSVDVKECAMVVLGFPQNERKGVCVHLKYKEGLKCVLTAVEASVQSESFSVAHQFIGNIAGSIFLGFYFN